MPIDRYQSRGTAYVLPVGETLSRAANLRALAVPFRIDVDGAVGVAEGRSAIVRQEMYSLLMTYLGERLMLPFYGSNLAALVWEQQALDVIGAYIVELQSLVEENFPGIVILALEPDQAGAEDGELVIRFDYLYDDQPDSIPIDVSMFLEATQ